MMKIYADTNFFTALYCPGPFEEEAKRLHAEAMGKGAEAYPVTLTGRLEMTNALQLAAYFTLHGVPGTRVSREYAVAVEALFLEQLVEGRFCRPATPSERLIEKQFMELSHRHTAKEGFRTYDVLHVASALVLGCDTFWTFDAKASKLAKLEGLKVNGF